MLQTAPKGRKDLLVLLLLPQKSLYFAVTDYKQPWWIRKDKHPLLSPMSESDVEILMMERNQLLGKFFGIYLLALLGHTIVFNAFAR